MTFLPRHRCRRNSSVSPCTTRRCQLQNNRSGYSLVNRKGHRGYQKYHRKGRAMGGTKEGCRHPITLILLPRIIDRKITDIRGKTLVPAEQANIKLCLDLCNSNLVHKQNKAEQCENGQVRRRIRLIQICRDKPPNRTSPDPRPCPRNQVSDQCSITLDNLIQRQQAYSGSFTHNSSNLHRGTGARDCVLAVQT